MVKLMQQSWWKLLAIFLLCYTVVGGLLFAVPRLNILNETIRNLYYHVPMWFGMIILFTVSLVYSILYLYRGKLSDDLMAVETANVGLLLGVLGLLTGMIWANYTWGSPWNGDPKQNMSAIALLIYFAYSILRASIPDPTKRARISAVYNIFAFFSMIPLLFVVPRLTDSLHPSNGGNNGFVVYDLDNQMRLVFYPAVMGFTLLGLWISSLRIRLRLIFDPNYNHSSL
ncbi:MAG: cytochrome c biogenesis protein CcsA [Bacteroidetes bacterium]|nr:cytochrome c biogenesis protein CcsA [Bacteroidota bacterium]MCB9043592.1 cytochrome c biogenesis protein CcsA [Chitinophagales bacterium]